MGYYADGNGSIVFKKVLPEELFQKVKDVLLDVFDCDGTREWKRYKEAELITEIDFWSGDKYYEDEVIDALKKTAELAGHDIEEGCISYCGEDNALWRFVYDKNMNSWLEENGHVEYSDFTTDVVLDALRKYFQADARENSGKALDRLKEACESENLYNAIRKGLPFSCPMNCNP